MIQTTALPTISLGSAMSEIPAENPGAGANPAQFAGVLAIQQAIPGQPALPGGAPEPSVAAAAPADPAIVPASPLPQTGKTLPPALPVEEPAPAAMATTTALQASSKSVPAPSAPEAPAETPARAEKHAAALVRPIAASELVVAAKPAKRGPAQSAAEPTPEREQADPDATFISAAPATLIPATPILPTGSEAPTPARAQTSAPAIALPSPSQAPVGGSPVAPGTDPLPIIPALTIAPPAIPAEHAKSVASHLAVSLTDTAPPQTGAASRLRIVPGMRQAAEQRPAEPALVLNEPTALPQPQLSAAGPLSGQPVPLSAPAAAAPSAELRHDFSQLVDTLIAAREAAMPHPVHASLNHTEFGQVQLTFAHDAAELTVAMSSNDPDFARAVAAATPAERPSGSGDSSGQSAGRGDNQPATSGQPQSQSQSQSLGQQQGQSQSGAQRHGSDARDGRPQPRQMADNPSTESTASATGPTSGRTGIFA